MEAPLPHMAGQLTMSMGMVEVQYGPLAVTTVTKIDRLPRRLCTACSNRRVCFSINFAGVLSSPPVCAKCAGIR